MTVPVAKHSEIVIDAAEAETLLEAIHQVDALHRKLGELRQAYLTEERAILSAIGGVEQSLQTIRALVAKKYLTDKPGRWVFDLHKKAYVQES